MTLKSETRHVTRNAEVRLAGDGKTLTAYAAIFDSPSLDLGFTETIAKGAFTRTLEEGDDVVALVEHDADAVRTLGRLSNDTLKLKQDDHGLHVTVSLPDTQTGNDLRELVKRGDITDMSFAFLPHDGGDTWSTDTAGKRHRRLESVQLFDISAVSTGAYPAAGELSVRKAAMSDTNPVSELQKLTNDMRALLDADVMTSEDEQKYDRMEARLAEVEADMRNRGRREKLESSEAELDKPTLQIRQTPRTGTDVGSTEYRDAFLASCASGIPTPELRVMVEGTGSLGGFTVPQALEAALVAELDAPGNIRAQVPVLQATTDVTKIPIEAAIGSGEWVLESGTISPADATLAEKSAEPAKVAAAVTVTAELIQDSILNIESWLGTVLGRRIAQTQEAAFMSGSGTNQPEGLFTLATATTTAMSSDALITFFFTLAAQYRANATWVMNDFSLAVIRKLKDDDGRYLWLPAETNADLRAGITGTLMGKPVVVNNHGANNEYVLADLDLAYRIYERGPTTMLMDPYSKALSGQIDLIATRRVDGLGIIADAIVQWDPA